jgi:hypothetical protein
VLRDAGKTFSVTLAEEDLANMGHWVVPEPCALHSLGEQVGPRWG